MNCSDLGSHLCGYNNFPTCMHLAQYLGWDKAIHNIDWHLHFGVQHYPHPTRKKSSSSSFELRPRQRECFIEEEDRSYPHKFES